MNPCENCIVEIVCNDKCNKCIKYWELIEIIYNVICTSSLLIYSFITFILVMFVIISDKNLPYIESYYIIIWGICIICLLLLGYYDFSPLIIAPSYLCTVLTSKLIEKILKVDKGFMYDIYKHNMYRLN